MLFSPFGIRYGLWLFGALCFVAMQLKATATQAAAPALAASQEISQKTIYQRQPWFAHRLHQPSILLQWQLASKKTSQSKFRFPMHLQLFQQGFANSFFLQDGHWQYNLHLSVADLPQQTLQWRRYHVLYEKPQILLYIGKDFFFQKQSWLYSLQRSTSSSWVYGAYRLALPFLGHHQHTTWMWTAQTACLLPLETLILQASAPDTWWVHLNANSSFDSIVWQYWRKSQQQGLHIDLRHQHASMRYGLHLALLSAEENYFLWLESDTLWSFKKKQQHALSLKLNPQGFDASFSKSSYLYLWQLLYQLKGRTGSHTWHGQWRSRYGKQRLSASHLPWQSYALSLRYGYVHPAYGRMQQILSLQQVMMQSQTIPLRSRRSSKRKALALQDHLIWEMRLHRHLPRWWQARGFLGIVQKIAFYEQQVQLTHRYQWSQPINSFWQCRLQWRWYLSHVHVPQQKVRWQGNNRLDAMICYRFSDNSLLAWSFFVQGPLITMDKQPFSLGINYRMTLS